MRDGGAAGSWLCCGLRTGIDSALYSHLGAALHRDGEPSDEGNLDCQLINDQEPTLSEPRQRGESEIRGIT
jgi:hypothetical protein